MASTNVIISNILRSLFIGVVFAITIAMNALLFFTLQWEPFDIVFHRPEMTYLSYQSRETLAGLCTFLSGLLLFTSSILLLLKIFLDKKISKPAVIITAPLFGLFLYSNTLYSKRNNQYFRNGYYYLEQRWSDKKNRQTRYKIWKSSKRGELKSHNIHWVLDTMYSKPWNRNK